MENTQPKLEKRILYIKFLKLFIVFAIIFAAFYYSFNTVMSAVIHSKKEITLPDIKGKSLAEAVEELSVSGLGLKKEGEEFSNSVPPGIILRQTPPAGMNIREGKIVKVTISRGGETIYIPNLVGKTVRAADIAIKSYGLMIGEVSQRYSIMVEKGSVVSQDPAAGTAADKDTVINIVVSNGQPPEGIIYVPDWKGKTPEDVKNWAGKNNVSVEVIKDKTSEFPSGTII
ncbi:MAG: PASTA domain-containing protein, partial [Endomicrobia bacterium]|nr:PASTA domain-containing protein [Endomicrobiia bacterium]